VFHFEAFIGDSLMSSTRKNFDSPREFTLPTADKLPKRVPAVYDAVLLAGVGDSVTIYETIDSFLQKFIPPGLKNEKEVRYEIVLEKIVSAEEIEKKREEEQRKMLEEQQKMEAMRPIVEKANAEAKKRFASVATMVKAKAKDYTSGKLADKLTTTASGLKILTVEKGGGEPIQKGEQIFTHYYGLLTNGTVFDNSFDKGQALPFAAGVRQMIPGFDEGAMTLNHGGKAYLFIPSQLGYGEQGQGSIPPNSELIFYIEVL
jgi:FKBP-type peptidyl-prolyl cis-trans isomerase FkpA